MEPNWVLPRHREVIRALISGGWELVSIPLRPTKGSGVATLARGPWRTTLRLRLTGKIDKAVFRNDPDGYRVVLCTARSRETVASSLLRYAGVRHMNEQIIAVSQSPTVMRWLVAEDDYRHHQVRC